MPFTLFMKPSRPSWLLVTLALSGLCLAGCQTPKKHPIPVGHGYEEVSHPESGQSGEGAFTRISFEFAQTNGADLLIWPSLYGVNEVIRDDLAIFVGDVARSRRGGSTPHLFMVQSPKLPVDITDEILWRWAKKAGKDFSTAQEKYSLVTPVDRHGHLELELEFWTDEGEKGWPEKAVLTLEWNQLPGLLRAAQQRAFPMEDLRWHTPYLRE